MLMVRRISEKTNIENRMILRKSRATIEMIAKEGPDDSDDKIGNISSCLRHHQKCSVLIILVRIVIGKGRADDTDKTSNQHDAQMIVLTDFSNRSDSIKKDNYHNHTNVTLIEKNSGL